MTDMRFWRWSVRAERPAIEHVIEDFKSTVDLLASAAASSRSEQLPVAGCEVALPMAPSPPSSRDMAFSVTDHSVSKPGQLAPLFNRVSLSFEAGATTFAIGLNGVGKTLFLKSLARLPKTCTLTVNGVRQRSGVAYFASRDKISDEPIRVDALLAAAGAPEALTSWALSDCAATPVQALSQGQKTRLILAVAEASNAPVLLLDEPTLGLDADAVARLDRFLAQRRMDGLITIVASHELMIVTAQASRVLLFERNHERTRITDATDRLVSGRMRFQTTDGVAVEADGALPEAARRLLDLQAARFTASP